MRGQERRPLAPAHGFRRLAHTAPQSRRLGRIVARFGHELKAIRVRLGLHLRDQLAKASDGRTVRLFGSSSRTPVAALLSWARFGSISRETAHVRPV